MLAREDLLGAIVAHVIYVSSILTFTSRLLGRPRWGLWFGIPLLLTAFPLAYLLFRAPAAGRPALYYVQVGFMLSWILLLLAVDYIWKVDFRHTRWMVIAFVVWYFGGLGGMLGLAGAAGRGWTISALILFAIAAVLAFVQRAVTGM